MTITVYITDTEKKPFLQWLYQLDKQARAITRTRIDRLKIGNFGNCDPVGDGVSELRIYYGPGYRVYFGQKGGTKVVLLFGGNKSTQRRDIAKAKLYWTKYKNNKDTKILREESYYEEEK